ncbi:MAG: hypothetical protein R3C68_17695 [Myxococcota bacterium]
MQIVGDYVLDRLEEKEQDRLKANPHHLKALQRLGDIYLERQQAEQAVAFL